MMPLRYRFEVRSGSLAPARRELRRWLQSAGVPNDIAEDLTVVASEFMTRAMRSGATHAFLIAELDGNDVEISLVVDESTTSNVAHLPQVADARLSQLLIEALCDDVSQETSPLTRIRCRRGIRS